MGLRLGIQLSVACHAWNSEFKPHCHHIQRLELKIWVLGTVAHACQSITLQTKVGGDQPRLWGVPKQLWRQTLPQWNHLEDLSRQ